MPVEMPEDTREQSTEARIVLTTLDSAKKAHELAHQLVERRVAACVNIVDRVHSVYRWGDASGMDAIEAADEFLLIIKTAASRVEALQQAIEELHPYQLPELMVLAVETVEREYLRWILSSTTPSTIPSAVLDATTEGKA